VAQGLADADGEHEGRLADGLAPVDHARLGGALEEADVEVLRALAEGGELVGGGSAGGQAAVLEGDLDIDLKSLPPPPLPDAAA